MIGSQIGTRTQESEPKAAPVYPPQIQAGLALVDAFLCGSSWNILRAQMQSGKTGTYLFVIAELFRRREIDSAIIMSGNTEISLQSQVRESIVAFHGSYHQYMVDTHPGVDDFYIHEKIRNRVSVFWGGDLHWLFHAPHLTQSKPVPVPNPNPMPVPMPANSEPKCRYRTLYVLDESHFAQNAGMRPSKVFAAANICPSGNNQMLESAQAFVLSVSATGFSELSNVHHYTHPKKIVTLMPDPAYLGLQTLLQSNMIVPFGEGEGEGGGERDDENDGTGPERTSTERTSTDRTNTAQLKGPWESVLSSLLTDRAYLQGPPQYSIVRVSTRTASTEFIHYLNSHPNPILSAYKCYTYNSISREPNNLDSLDILSTPPQQHSLIFIQNKCRMGQVLAKSHIGFCMETSTTSNTDVVLQGLVGRMCGYHSHTNIRVYIPTEIIARGDLARYIQFAHGDPVIPHRGTNLVRPRVSKLTYHPIIPIRLRLTQEDATLDPSNAFIAASIQAEFTKELDVIGANFNGDLHDPTSQAHEIWAMVTHGTVRVRSLKIKGGAIPPSWIIVAKNIYESIQTKSPRKLGGPCAASGEVSAWHFTIDMPEYNIRSGDIYIEARTKVHPKPYIPQTASPTSTASSTQLDPTPSPPVVADITHTTGREQYMSSEDKTYKKCKNANDKEDVDAELRLPICTMNDLDALKQCLCAAADKIRETATGASIYQVKTNQLRASKKNKTIHGIYVAAPIFQQLLPNGTIQQLFRAIYPELVLHVRKSNGSIPTGDLYQNMVRLCEISITRNIGVNPSTLTLAPIPLATN